MVLLTLGTLCRTSKYADKAVARTRTVVSLIYSSACVELTQPAQRILPAEYSVENPGTMAVVLRPFVAGCNLILEHVRYTIVRWACGPYTDLLQTNIIVTGLTAAVILYTRSAGIAYFALGAVVCSRTVKAVKRFIRQPRPVHPSPGRQKKSYG